MGLFSLVKGAFAASLEKQRGDTLAEDMQVHINHLSSVSPDIQVAAVSDFLEKRAELISQKAHWSDDKQVEMGRSLRTNAEQVQKQLRGAITNEDWAKCWGLWTAGAWLESGVGKSERAYISHMVLEQMASAPTEKPERTIFRNPNPRPITQTPEREDSKDQYNYALKFIDGDVVPRDFNEAAIWLRKAAAQGYADAQYLLGIMHEGGEGATQDIQQAISYMRKAAEQGYTEAQAWLVAQERKFSAENIVTYPPAEKQTADETPLSDKGDFYSIGWLVSKQWHKLPFSKKRYYYDILDLLTGLALGQSLSKWVSTIFHGSPDASGWVAAISLALGGGVGYFLCHYTRTQFTKNMQSRSAVIFWSISIPIGLTLAIITTTVLLEKSSAQPTSDGIVDPFAPGYVAPGSNEEFLQNVTKNFQEKCAGQEGIDFLNCWADYSPKKCKSLVYGQPVNPTWARCVYSCGSAGMYSKTFGDCARR